MTNTPNDDDRVPLWKQIMGAVCGGALALALYYGYEYAKPVVTAYLTVPYPEEGRMYDLGATNIADKSLEEDERRRVASRNMQAAERMRGRQMDPGLMEAVDNHVFDINWKGHTEPEEAEEEVIEGGVQDDEGWEVAYTEPQDGIPGINNALFLQEVATQEVPVAVTADADVMKEAPEDEWEELWGKVKEEDEEYNDEKALVRSNADALPDSGVGLTAVLLGSSVGAAAMRRKKRA